MNEVPCPFKGKPSVNSLNKYLAHNLDTRRKMPYKTENDYDKTV